MPNTDRVQIADPDWMPAGIDSDVEVSHKQDEYNKWRQKLPNHCWHCYNFDRCAPTTKCLHNPYYKEIP